jgi:hypothetical protein
MTFSLTETQAWLAFGAAALTIVVHVASTTWIAVQARRAWIDSQDRKAVESRALELIALAKFNSAARYETNASGQAIRADKEARTFAVGDDRLRDRAAFLAVEWGAVKIQWIEGRYRVSLRGPNDPPDS